MALIAGHAFIWGSCSCGRRWTDIRNCSEDDLDKMDIAHSGRLTPSELNAIVKERAAEDARIEAAMGSVTGRVQEAAMEEVSDINVMVPF